VSNVPPGLSAAANISVVFARNGTAAVPIQARTTPFAFTVGRNTSTNVVPTAAVPPTLAGRRSALQFLLTAEDLVSSGLRPGTASWFVDFEVVGNATSNAAHVHFSCGNTSRRDLISFDLSVPATAGVAMQPLLVDGFVPRTAMVAGSIRLALTAPLVFDGTRSVLCELNATFPASSGEVGGATNGHAGLRMRMSALPLSVVPVLAGVDVRPPPEPLAMVPFVQLLGAGSLVVVDVPTFAKKTRSVVGLAGCGPPTPHARGCKAF
jgi:hypothetical protein